MNQPTDQASIYDLIIIGSGPAGLTAAIYASRYKMSNLVLAKQKGGTIGLAHMTQNCPGFFAISGLELMAKIEEQAQKLGSEIVYDPAEDIKTDFDGTFLVTTDSGKTFKAKTLVLATGTERRKLNIPGEEEFLGRGVSYCTTCDAPFFREKTVALIGGSDAAVSGAIHTAEYAQKVYLIYRGEQLRAEPIWIENMMKNNKIEPIFSTNVIEIKGEQTVKSVVLDRSYQGNNQLPLEGVFIEIGGVPGTGLAKLAGVELNEGGFVKVDKEMKTNVAGIFAAGDMTDFLPRFQQLVTAQAMGALAAASAYQFVKQQPAPAQKGE